MYLETNRYEEREVEKRSLDKYSAALKAGKPQIFNVYWSKPQVMARQDPRLAETRAFSIACGSTKACSTPTCSAPMPTGRAGGSPGTRRSAFPHTWTQAPSNGGSTPAYQKVYANIFAGDWRGYDPFDATHRLKTYEIPSPAVCSMFRTYQGWTALTRQGPKDGTLRLITMAAGIAYVLLCAVPGAAGREARVC